MKYEIEIIKKLHTDNGKVFKAGQEISFTQNSHQDRYIGKIIDITQDSLLIGDIELNKNPVDGEMQIPLQNVDDMSCDYVFVD